MPRSVSALLCVLCAAPLAAQPAPVELEPEERSPRCALGKDVAFVDDLNGDGRRDVLVGAPSLLSVNESPPGCAYLFDGRTGAQLLSLAPADHPSFGQAVSPAGDVTGDGRGDLAVYAFPNVYYYDGASGALVRTVEGAGPALALADDLDGDGVPELLVGEGQSGSEGGAAHVVSGADGSVLRSIQAMGGLPPRELGLGVASIGDVDGDAVADFALGDGGTSDRDADLIGFVHVVSGATAAHLYTVLPVAPDVGIVREGIFGENWTIPLAGIPDLDGDGVPDFAVGASRESFEISTEGSAYVFSGATGTLLYRVQGEGYVGQFGRSLAGIQDVDGDGAGDLIVGESSGDGPELLQEGPGTARLLSGADGSERLKLSAPEGASLFGEAVDAYVDAGGALHVVVSAPWSAVGDAEAVGRGRVFLYSGVQAVAAEPDAGTREPVALLAPYPNPTQAHATVPFRLDAAGPVRLAVYDVLGREVVVLAAGPHAPGTHRARIAPGALPAGLYLIRLQTPSSQHVRRLVVAE